MVKEFISYYGKNIDVESKLLKGAKEFLNWCKKNNISMGVCTNKQEYLAVDLLKKIKRLRKLKNDMINFYNLSNNSLILLHQYKFLQNHHSHLYINCKNYHKKH